MVIGGDRVTPGASCDDCEGDGPLRCCEICDDPLRIGCCGAAMTDDGYGGDVPVCRRCQLSAEGRALATHGRPPETFDYWGGPR
jgi:hypothetical protein